MYETEIISEPGDKENQDRVKVIKRADSLLMILADGAGGMADGSNAAENAIRFAAEYERDGGELFDCDKWVKVISEIDKLIYADNESGETTIIAVAVKDDYLCGAGVGDSGIWNIQNRRIADIAENQHRKPLIGSGISIPVCFEKYNYSGSLLTATDGLLKYADKERIIKADNIMDIKAAAKAMTDSVRLKSGRLWDDTTLILYRNH